MQVRFHAPARERTQEIVGHPVDLRLPALEVLFGIRWRLWFPVPGIYGGCSIRFEARGGEAALVANSWCRVSGGSERQHVIIARVTHEMPRDDGPTFVIVEDE